MTMIFLSLFAILTSSVVLSATDETVSLIETLKIQINPESEIVINNMTWNDFKLWMFKDDTAVAYNDYNASYNCNNFSDDLRISAEKEEITIYRTVILVEGKIGHSINYGCFTDGQTNKPTCALIEPQTGKVFSNISYYVRSYDGEITSIIVKEGIYGENEKSIRRIY